MLGRNLAAANIPAAGTRFVETYGGAVPKVLGIRALLAERGPQRRGVIHEGWKLIEGGDGPELFCLQEDPKEERNLASKRPDLVQELTKLVKTWDKECPRGKARQSHLSEEDVQVLKSLGYLE
jgi:hypothetical protein